MRRTIAWATVAVLALASNGSKAPAQVGSVGSVRETGGPLRERSRTIAESAGSVRESTELPIFDAGRPLSGLPVSAGRQGVYGSGSVRDGSAGCVSDMKFVPASGPLFFEAPPLASPQETLTSLELSVRRLQPSESDGDAVAGQDPEVDSPSGAPDGAEYQQDDTSTTVQPEFAEQEQGSQHDWTEKHSGQALESQQLGADEAELLLSGEPTE
ncbi:MAG: hypothetical protein N3C12_10265 [Candidatus Binatia bacterium]|nr:hypothetical protein [Candidatus Binatia bacterium]